jgi:hypothetical protein
MIAITDAKHRVEDAYSPLPRKEQQLYKISGKKGGVSYTGAR